jgi:S1-C subfamily serine protease
MNQPFPPRRLSPSVDTPSPNERYPVHHPPPSPATRWLAVLLLLVAAALVVMVVRQQHGPGPAPVVSEPRTVTPRGDLAGDEQATIDLFQRASPSVVQITSLQNRRSRIHFNVMEIPQGTGSGFVWDDRGHVVTNYHVIQNADRAEVTLSDNSVWSADIVGVAPDKDLAVLKIDAPPGKLGGIAVGTSADLQVGQKVFAIGNPFGLDQTLTTGIISGLGREIQSVTRRPIYDVIQTDAAINRGNSGGPLLDSHGRLIGVNTAIYSPSGASAGVGFAVPVDTVNRIVPQLIQHGRIVRPGLGIHIGNDQLADQLNLQGVLVIDVPPDSAAGTAGLEGAQAAPSGRWILGDIIVAVDGEAVRNSSDLYRVLDQREVGETVTLTVDRNGKRRDLEVKLQPLP